MKNLYNTIEENLKAGIIVVVEDLEDNTYCVISTNKGFEGNYKYSGWEISIEDAKQFIGRYDGNTKDFWDNKDLEIVEVYRPEYEPFKVGQKVRLLDSIKKNSDWVEVSDFFCDMTGEIDEVYFSIAGIYYSMDGYYIGHEYLAPLAQEVEELTMEEVCKLLGRDIKIKK